MDLVVAKFGGSTMGDSGRHIPKIIQNVRRLSGDAKVLAVFSAPLAVVDGRRRSLTDVVMRQGYDAARGIAPSLDVVEGTYENIMKQVDDSLLDECRRVVRSHLDLAMGALQRAHDSRQFAGPVRAEALGYSGELLTSQVMDFVFRSNGLDSSFIPYKGWPIITNENYEYASFLISRSARRLAPTIDKIENNLVTCLGGFIGKSVGGQMTTYERGGTDRSAADMGILLHKHYNVRITWVKDSVVVSADPQVVTSGLSEVGNLSYSEARMAGMFGMKILDSMAMKEILDNGVDIPLQITDMNNPDKVTLIRRLANEETDHPIKIVTGRGNCAIMRIKSSRLPKLQSALGKQRYNEFVILSPYLKNSVWFSRVLFTDGDYVRRNEEYLMKADPGATIVHNRAVITLIGDLMWRVQQVVSKAAFSVGEAGINILNMDAQEETSDILIIIEDHSDNLDRAIRAVHEGRREIKFI